MAYALVDRAGELWLVKYSEDQPRDSSGRFGSGDGGSSTDTTAPAQTDSAGASPVPGWSREMGGFGDLKHDELLANGYTPAQTEAWLRGPQEQTAIWRSDDGKTVVGFVGYLDGPSRVPPERQAEFVQQVTDLRASNPIGSPDPLIIEVVPPGASPLTADAEVVFGNDGRPSHIEVGSSAFTPGADTAMAYSGAPVADGVRNSEYAITHEYGHLIDFDREPRVMREGVTIDTIPSARAAAMEHPSPSTYGRESALEKYAEAFTQFRLDSPGPLARALAEQDGWK